MTESVELLLQDGEGFWCDQAQLYLSQSSQSLMSHHPAQVVEEVIATYCPQCLTRYLEEEALASQSRCRSCYQCPRCTGVLVAQSTATTTSSGKTIRELGCTTCKWTAAAPSAPPGEAAPDAASTAFSMLLKAHTQREQQLLLSTQPHHHHQKRTQQAAMQGGRGARSVMRWTFSDLEKQAEKSHGRYAEVDLLQGLTLASSSAASISAASTEKADNGALVPQRFKLLSKRTIRSKRDFDTSKFNILVQPKPNPLDGDSTMKQTGDWWVKDSSAIHTLPLLSILYMPRRRSDLSEDGRGFIALRIRNPKEAPMELQVRVGLSIIRSKELADQRYCRLDQLGKAVLVSPLPFLCLEPAAAGQEQAEEVVTVALEPYEDELLKDETDHVNVYDVVQQWRKEHISSPPVGGGGGWTAMVQGNIGLLRIPVQWIEPAATEHQSSPTVLQYEVLLALHVKVEDLAIDVPTRIVMRCQS